MATSNELRAWASALRGWAQSVDNTKVRERMIQLAVEFEKLAQKLGHLFLVVVGAALIVGLGCGSSDCCRSGRVGLVIYVLPDPGPQSWARPKTPPRTQKS